MCVSWLTNCPPEFGTSSHGSSLDLRHGIWSVLLAWGIPLMTLETPNGLKLVAFVIASIRLFFASTWEPPE